MKSPMVSEPIYDIDDLPEGDYIYQEKKNGIRGTYNPNEGIFRTINGNEVPGVKHLEAILKHCLHPLDGEFFLPHLTAAKISGQARKKSPEHLLEFHVFDMAVESMTDEARQAQLDECVYGEYIKRIKTYRGNKADVFAFLKEVLARDGEGVIIRDPFKIYRFGENGTIKLKEIDIPDGFKRWDK